MIQKIQSRSSIHSRIFCIAIKVLSQINPGSSNLWNMRRKQLKTISIFFPLRYFNVMIVKPYFCCCNTPARIFLTSYFVWNKLWLTPSCYNNMLLAYFVIRSEIEMHNHWLLDCGIDTQIECFNTRNMLCIKCAIWPQNIHKSLVTIARFYLWFCEDDHRCTYQCGGVQWDCSKYKTYYDLACM